MATTFPGFSSKDIRAKVPANKSAVEKTWCYVF